MKILQLTNKPPWPAKDGGAIAVLNLAKGFGQLGHQVTILAMNTRKHHSHPDEIPDEIRQNIHLELVDIPAVPTSAGALLNFLFSREPYTSVRFISASYGTALIRLLQENKFDIVQLEGHYLCPYIPLIRNYSAAKISLRAHNIESEIWNRSAESSRGIRKLYFRDLASRIREFELKWINRYDFLVPITDRDAEHLDHMGNNRPAQVIPAGIDRSILYPAWEMIEYPTLFHIGSLDWIPNQEGLLWFLDNCWPEILTKYPYLNFYIAGRNAPQWLITRLRKPGVIYMGEVKDACEFMHSKAIEVVPLFSGSGMRVKIVEGMALGKTIVTTSTGAEGLQVSDGVNILIADTPGPFISGISLLLENEPYFRQIGEKAVQFIRAGFDHLLVAGRLLDFYQNHL
jgi:glycosyltransferase involved in cell wall biosynthesis